MPDPDPAGGPDDRRLLIEETARRTAEELARRLAETRPGPDQQRHTGPTVAETVAGFLADAERRLARGKLQPDTLAGGRRALSALVAAFGPTAAPGPGWQWVWRPGS